MKQAWSFFVFALIGWFVVSCVEQFAQAKQAELDGDDSVKKEE
jgi:hypothetical protein